MNRDGGQGSSPLAQEVLGAGDGLRVEGVLQQGVGHHAVLRHVATVGVEQRRSGLANKTPELRNQLLVHLASHVTCQLSTDVTQGVLAGFIPREVVGREHRTTSGDGRVLGVGLGLLASVVAGLVQSPAVAGVDALFDVVQRCEEGTSTRTPVTLFRTASGRRMPLVTKAEFWKISVR